MLDDAVLHVLMARDAPMVQQHRAFRNKENRGSYVFAVFLVEKVPDKSFNIL
jgi:hypothetical protein